MFTAGYSTEQQLEHELWLREIAFLEDEIAIMKRHLADLYYGDLPGEIVQSVVNFDEKFRLQQIWLEKMKTELQFFDGSDTESDVGLSPGECFRLRMQANRIVNEELKNCFLKLFS